MDMHVGDKIKQTQGELRAKGVKYCIGAYVDIHGVPKGKVVPIDSLRAHGARLRALHRLRARRSRPGAERRRDRLGSRSRPHHPAAVEAQGRLDPGRQHLQGRALSVEHARRSEERSRPSRRAWASASISASSAEVYRAQEERRRQARNAEPRRQSHQALLRRAAAFSTASPGSTRSPPASTTSAGTSIRSTTRTPTASSSSTSTTPTR